MKLEDLTTGSDPEFMLFSKRDNRIVSAIPVLKQGKENKIDLGNGFNFYYDNVMMEGNLPPANSKEEFVNNVRELLTRMKQNLDPNYEPVCVAANEFTNDELDNPIAREIGCSPEMDVYEMNQVFPPDFSGNDRSSGGHFHSGRKDYQNPNDDLLLDPYSKVDLIKVMDIFLGVPMSIIDKDPTSLRRKSLYGQPGRFRCCDYGIEYRVLGNYWLRSPELTSFSYDLVENSVKTLLAGQVEEILSKVSEEEVKNTIKTNDVDCAQKLLKQSMFPENLHSKVMELANQTFDTQTYKNWGL